MQNNPIAPVNLGIVHFCRDMAESLKCHLITYFTTAVSLAESAPVQKKAAVEALFPLLTEKITAEIKSRCDSQFSAHLEGRKPFAGYKQGSAQF